ncbi:hypothetical protein BGZ96_005035 [Linnemannia gamsii]|uniref:F-box domain-containing protein n=1 Tax=Linnemannia gamsii TaxID=64522 RepID=A0ABQ7K5L2_9FUNG|nr:hypothetical protein BGZ96_005035 [Linnemannia gamsii]
MPSLPNEVVFAIGEHLTKRSAFDAILVCRQWSEVLRSFLLSSIRKTAWHHSDFPIKYHCATDINDPVLAFQLHHVKLLEWHNNISLTSRKVLSSTGCQIPTARLGTLLTMMPNLTVLLLRMEMHGPDPVFFEAISGLQTLKTLKANMPAGEVAIPIERMFPLFSRLDELHLEGTWYQHKTNTLPRLPGEGEKTPWRIKRLKIDLWDISLVRHCPDLEHLRLLPRTKSYAGRMRQAWDLLTELMSAPTNLRGLMLHSFKHQKCLSFKVCHGGKSGRPHMMLNTTAVNQKKWWSTEDVIAFL